MNLLDEEKSTYLLALIVFQKLSLFYDFVYKYAAKFFRKLKLSHVRSEACFDFNHK